MLEIIDTQDTMDNALKNSKMLKALLAISAKYSYAKRNEMFKLFYNCKRVLAHTFKKFPDLFKLNLLKSKTRPKRLRFKPEEIEQFW